jgi:hypothetical protein
VVDKIPLKYKNLSGAKLTVEQAKATILELLEQGFTIADACKVAGRSIKSYEGYKTNDSDFRKQVDVLRAIQARGGELLKEDAEISFQEFRLKYLGSQTFPHQMNMIDLLEDREPSWLHDSMVYEPGEPQSILINIPPNHAKSTTVTLDYVTYRICLDPTIQIKIVSKTQSKASEFLHAVKQRLTSDLFPELQKRYAPTEGFKATSDKWTSTQIYLARDSANPDPTVEALGIGGHLYGARADLIILDDCVTLGNAREYDKQMRWIQQDCITRLGPTGKLLVVGTRVDPIDLYKELRNDTRYVEGDSPWTYLSMPAVLEFYDDPDDWVTLWPYSDQPWKNDKTPPNADGLYPRWDGNRLKKLRSKLEAHTWAMVYQQQDVSSESIFLKEAVQGSIDGMRASGPIVKGAPGHPDLKVEPYVICSMDPAMSGDTFTIAYAGDHTSQHRYVLETSKMTAPTPAKIREIIFSWTDKYRPKVWVIEKNAFQLFLTQDEQINQFLATRGIRLVQHYTGNNKMDVEFGVASVSPLFGHVDALNKHMGDNLIHLPRADNESVKALIEQLVTWSPGTRNKSDGPMSLWFAETQMRQYLTQTGIYQTTTVKNPFVTRGDAAKRRTVNLDEWAEYQEELKQQGGGYW